MSSRKTRDACGSILRQARARNKISQWELARRASTSASHIGRIERSEVEPPLPELVSLLGAMDTTLEISMEFPPGKASGAALFIDLLDAMEIEPALQIKMTFTGEKTQKTNSAKTKDSDGTAA